MINKIKNWASPLTVDDILSSFSKTLSKLEELKDRCKQRDEEIQEQVQELQQEQVEVFLEQKRAASVAEKIREIIE